MMKTTSSTMMMLVMIAASRMGTDAQPFVSATPANNNVVENISNNNNDVPTGRHWISLGPDVQYIPSSSTASSSSSSTGHHHEQQRGLRQLWERHGTGSGRFNGMFADGSETVYDDYATAWRFMGFYQDCNACVVDGDGNNEIQSAAYCIANGMETSCQRYALWAAYVDLDYQGNGPAEYKYYDRSSGRYNDAACKAADSTRCVKMDCHEPGTHYSLLGFFKHAQYDTFLDALFGYQGDCVWTDDEYKFMMMAANGGGGDGGDGGDASSSWPLNGQCTATAVDGVYYDMKPTRGGNMDIGLYEDDMCSSEYSGSEITVDDVWASSSSDGSGRAGQLKAWNAALDAFKVCTPCVTYDLVSLIHPKGSASQTVNENGDRYQQQQQQQDAGCNDDAAAGDDDANENADAGGGCDGGGAFVCSDNGGGDNGGGPVNQCQVFAKNANLMKASYRDVVLAESQNTVTGVNAAGVQLGNPPKRRHVWLSVLFLLGSLTLCFYALRRLYRKDRANNPELDEPLVGRNRSNATTSTTNGGSSSNSKKANRSSSRNSKHSTKSSGSTRNIS